MATMTISDAARRVGLKASALRYYERIGVVQPALRSSGQRRYDDAALQRLATLQRAREMGFSLREIKVLFFGFRDGTRAAERWRSVSRKKAAELEELMGRIRAIQALLQRQGKCSCATLEECGEKSLQRECGKVSLKPLRISRRDSVSQYLARTSK